MSIDRIPLASPDIEEADVEAVVAVLRSGRLSRGPAIAAFEAGFADYHGVAASVGVSSGTAGLMCALDAVGVRPGDQVITVSLSFVATANSIVRLGAEPVFVDVSPGDLNMDPDAISAAVTDRTRAIVVVHLFGQLADMAAITAVAARHGLAVVEDACEALGARNEHSHAGTLGDVGVFGFYANKPITTAEGGCIVSRSRPIIDTCRRLRNHGRDEDGAYRVPMAGFNFRLSELQAALGLAQLSRLPDMLEKRQSAADRYYELLGHIDGLRLPDSPRDNARHAWFTFPVRLPTKLAGDRETIRQELRAAGIETGNYFHPIHLLPYYRSVRAGGEAMSAERENLSVTEAESKRLLALPLYPGLSEAGIQRVAKELEFAIERRSN